MLTPVFDLIQDDDFVILTIKAPYSKLSEAEIIFEGTDVKFYSKPYFLRLNLPACVQENGKESAVYNAIEGSFLFKLPKASPGEWFEGLDLQTKLLSPRKKVFAGPLVEVFGTEGNSNEDEQNVEEEDFDWEIYQNQYTEEDTASLLIENTRFGFANQKTDVKLLSRIQEEMPELLDVRLPHQKTMIQRREERILTEQEDFSDDHYLADIYEDEEIKRLSAYYPSWLTLEQEMNGNSTSTLQELVIFTKEEKTKMQSLPNKEYLLDHGTKQEVLLGLVDILFAYAYNVRTTEGDNCVESAWTISKLSATLSWLETFSSLESVVLTSLKRSLCYPLYRQWDLAVTVLGDTIQILSLGTRYVLKCLLEIHSIFAESDPRYIMNDLYITDYCVWIQTVRDQTLLNLAQALQKISLNKVSLGLDLPILEQAAALALQDAQKNDSDEDTLPQQFQRLEVDNCCSDSHSSDTTDPSVNCSSDSDSSDEDSSSSSSSSSLDSDDYSGLESDDSSNDSDSNDSDSSGENGLLLGNVQSLEKIRNWLNLTCFVSEPHQWCANLSGSQRRNAHAWLRP